MTRNDREFMAQEIRAQYMEKQATELEELRRLDREARRPANLFAYIFGSIGAVIMGSGMSLVMTDIGEKINIANGLVPGIIIGVLGLAISVINYPLYKHILKSRKKKYAEKIIALSDKLMAKEGN